MDRQTARITDLARAHRDECLLRAPWPSSTPIIQPITGIDFGSRDSWSTIVYQSARRSGRSLQMEILQERLVALVASGMAVPFNPIPLSIPISPSDILCGPRRQKLTGADLYESLFPMPAKGRRYSMQYRAIQMLTVKSCGSTREECLAELQEKLPHGVTCGDMQKGKRYA